MGILSWASGLDCTVAAAPSRYKEIKQCARLSQPRACSSPSSSADVDGGTCLQYVFAFASPDAW